VPANGEIEASYRKRGIHELSAELGLDPACVRPHRHHIRKVPIQELAARADRPDGALILVTAMTPTQSGEGKTATSIGLADALRQAGRRTALCLREPSLGVTFGMKGRGTGAGHVQVVPAEDINLHFAGDMHAVGAANQPARGAVRQPSPARQRARHRPASDQLAARGGSERSRPARDRDRARRGRPRCSAHRRIQHHPGVGGDGGAVPGRGHPRPPGSAGPDRGRLQRGKSPSRLACCGPRAG
jgi:hypothetical protein